MRKQRPPQHMPQPPPGHTGTGIPLPLAPPPGVPRYVVATDQADCILPFLVSGGYTFWPSVYVDGTPGPGELVDYQALTAGDGAQLVCSAYVPWGKVGFIKELRIAPLKPSVLQDVWNTTGLTPIDPAAGGNANFIATYESMRAAANTYSGIWDVPMGWEAYDVENRLVDEDVDGGWVFKPYEGGFVSSPWDALGIAWEWSITVLDGKISEQRAALPVYDRNDPTSWYLTESIPVPGPQTYPNGFPGRPIGVPQRMQVMPGDALRLHAVIPSNSTVCLWARWFNRIGTNADGLLEAGVRLKARATTGPQNDVDIDYPPQGFESKVPVIGPSVGSMLGYNQPEVSHGSNENAVVGWGG